MYKDLKSQKAQQNYIPKYQNVLESGETLKSPRKTINIETPKSCSPEIGIAESVGSPKISMVYSRNCSFRGEKKRTDCPVQDCGKGADTILLSHQIMLMQYTMLKYPPPLMTPASIYITASIQNFKTIYILCFLLSPYFA
ncbi:hypothetical protein SUGI_0547210 [Cryptomeria japonica]|nr:hypothetical protein SUGI_0547210 [Cryptomeria japonica]